MKWPWTRSQKEMPPPAKGRTLRVALFAADDLVYENIRHVNLEVREFLRIYAHSHWEWSEFSGEWYERYAEVAGVKTDLVKSWRFE